MSFRTSLQKSAWSCETNMCSAIDQATRLTTLAGASLRSSCAHPKGFRRSASFPRLDTTHLATKSLRSPFYSLRYVCLLACGIALFASTAFAQIPVPSTPPPPPGQDVNEAAITLVQASNPHDEAFVVNFNDDFYLDLDKDFTNSIPELKEALERIDSRGSTAMRDAIMGSLDHLKKASKDKKVLLVVTD